MIEPIGKYPLLGSPDYERAPCYFLFTIFVIDAIWSNYGRKQ